MSFFATARFFNPDANTPLRIDTKLWFSAPPVSGEGICIGAVVGLNPGSSKQRANKDGTAEVDRTMANILTAFADAYTELGREIPENAYVRIWNLCYVREAASRIFLKEIGTPERFAQLTSAAMLDPTEDEPVPCLWFAWTASAPRRLAIRSRRWWEKSNSPIAYLGPDGLPHRFAGESDCSAVRHPCRKTREELAATVRFLLSEQ